MSEPSFHQQSVLWGQAYEVLVKRGVLFLLMERRLIEQDRPSLAAWKGLKLKDVSRALHRALDVTDPEGQAIVSAGVEHLALTAFGTGYTAMRAYLHALKTSTKPFLEKELRVKALWCPLTMPGEVRPDAEEREERKLALVGALGKELGVSGLHDPHWAAKGQPANADFMLWLNYGGRADHLLVQEYSFDMPGELQDYRDQEAHLDELTRHRRVVDSRSVFARVTAEVDKEYFELSEDLRHYLLAMTGDNKPLYKLCQASSYAAATADLLRDRGLVNGPLHARALAITPNGLESLAALIGGAKTDPRHKLLLQLGQAYQETRKAADGDEQALKELATRAFMGTLKKLPREMQAHMRTLHSRMPLPGEDYAFEFEEQTSDFHNPDGAFTLAEALALVRDDDPKLHDFFGGDARLALQAEMEARLKKRGRLSLRDVHASAIVAGLKRGQKGKLNLIALEGNPGIGKTTAVKDYLSGQTQGFLVLYVSPRVVINRDVTASLARKDDRPSGILTLTTNANLIASAEPWHKKQVADGKAQPKKVDGALVADGVEQLKHPDGSILVLSPEQEQEVENEHSASKLFKNALSEYEDLVQDRALPGVLKTLAGTARELLALNGQVSRLVLTAALQGFRERSNQKTTIEALSTLFANKWDTMKGVDERRAFARLMPNIVVMVDELAGDGAGAPFVHAIAAWLRQEFLDPFDGEVSPFTVTLIASDASLGNELVLARYLDAGERTPDKVLVSRSRGKRPFDMAVTSLPVRGRKERTLHVMTNSFPASSLTLRYKVRLTNVHVGETDTGQEQTVRQAIREKAEDALLESACKEIDAALAANAAQVIYFAQDKQFLRAIEEKLTEGAGALKREQVAILDSSVPAYERKRLLEPAVCDQVRVFLMTSSGARGVSFPKTDWIIASVPRFNVEAALMEIAQLIYRGRGSRRDADGNVTLDGDNTARTLVFTVDDFVATQDGIDERQWLRQSLDLMTLLVMLRATVFTRITGDAALSQPLALVPVGSVGVEELISLMSQYVSAFVKEARLYRSKAKSSELANLATRALDNVEAIFTRTHLQGIAKRDSDERTYVRSEDARAVWDTAANGMRALLALPEGNRTLLAEHMSFSGPVVVENWGHFEKQEVFAFEEHDAVLVDAVRKLKGQLHEIDNIKSFPSALRNPAAALLRLLYREEHEEANEFKTLKALKSPNTWVAMPAGYNVFTNPQLLPEGREFVLKDDEMWHEALARTLGSGAVIPPVPAYKSFPWAACVGRVSPLKLDMVFDDRYFMASNELNLLNTLLLSRTEADDAALAGSRQLFRSEVEVS